MSLCLDSLLNKFLQAQELLSFLGAGLPGLAGYSLRFRMFFVLCVHSLCVYVHVPVYVQHGT